MRAFIETPWEIVFAIVSVYSGTVIFAFHETTPVVPNLLQWVAAASITTGGVIVLAARLCTQDCARLERAGNALLVVTFAAYATWALVLQGVSWMSVQSVIALYAIAAGYAVRNWKIGVALRAAKQIRSMR